MLRIIYLDPWPPPKRRKPGVGSSWPEEKKKALNPNIKHQAGLAQAEGSSLSASAHVGVDSQQLIGIETLLTTIAGSDPDRSQRHWVRSFCVNGGALDGH
jgi:hypothetical protein